MSYTFGGKYKLEEEIANGGCGTVFLGVHTVAGKEVAIKVEPAVAKHSLLKQESKIYKTLVGAPGVPWILWSGKQGDYNVMIIDLLGPSLEDLFKMCNRHFTLKTVLLLTDQLIDRIQYIHSRSLVHRDIKPANFVMGPPSSASAHLVNVIDFGLAKKFRDARTTEHIPYRQDEHHGVGTSLFASLNTHLGVECSRRDDLESLSYMLVYFLRGTLPWRKMKGKTTAETWNLIRDSKLAFCGLAPPPSSSSSPTSSSSKSRSPPSSSHPYPNTTHLPSPPTNQPLPLTAGLPEEFEIFHRYALSLEFGDLPDYDGLRGLLRGLAERHGIEYDNTYDWSVPGMGGKAKGLGRSSSTGVKRRTCEACAMKMREKAKKRPLSA